MAPQEIASSRPLITLAISVYGVEEYVPAFLESLDSLDVDRSIVEVVIVDDGSPDDSARIISSWIPTSGFQTVFLRRENAGLSAARNLALSHATGEWISFPDPDDLLSPTYLRRVVEFVTRRAAENVSLVATRILQFVEDPAEPLGGHALDFKFDRDVRVVDLDVSPRYIQVHAASAFFRTDTVRGAGLAFDERVSPVFEDGVFVGMYLLASPRPVVAFLGNAEYYYRKRASQTSLTDTSWEKPGRYGAIFRYGYMELFRRAPDRPPTWLQNLVLYDLRWYLKADERNASPTARLDEETKDRLAKHFDAVLARVDDETILRFNSASLSIEHRYAFLARKNGFVPTHDVGILRLDRAQEIQMMRYYTTNFTPGETVRVDGAPSEPVFAKTTAMAYFGRTWLYERDLWVTAVDPVSIEIDGELRRIQLGGVYRPIFEALPNDSWWRFHRRPMPAERDRSTVSAGTDVSSDAPAVLDTVRRRATRVARAAERRAGPFRRFVPSGLIAAPESASGPVGPTPEQLHAERVIARARSIAVRRRFRNAWVLIDRDTLAQDNAEAFYRYLRRAQPQVNAWFVISRHSQDWDRLKADGFRLVAHGTDEHVMLMLNARQLISSQIDWYIVKPYDTKLYPRGRWKYVFLQHGVTKDDLSRWINTKPIRLMITATEPEHRSIVANGSPYRFSEKEVALTGFPRHDSLLAKARRLDPRERRDLVIMPTWRDTLLHGEGGTNARRLRPGFWESDFARAWFGLLRSPELAAAAKAAGVSISFVPHPNFQDHIDPQSLPDGVRLVYYRDHDIQEVIARAGLVVTDYSSLAFEAAYVSTPVVYFQFDREQFFSGEHAYRRGYFSYQDDGFGPVVDTLEEAVQTLATMLADGYTLPTEYRRRIDHAFKYRDERNSQRLYDAIQLRQRSRVRKSASLSPEP